MGFFPMSGLGALLLGQVLVDCSRAGPQLSEVHTDGYMDGSLVCRHRWVIHPCVAPAAACRLLVLDKRVTTVLTLAAGR